MSTPADHLGPEAACAGVIELVTYYDPASGWAVLSTTALIKVLYVDQRNYPARSNQVPCGWDIPDSEVSHGDFMRI